MSPHDSRLANGLGLSVEPLPGHGGGLVSVALTVAAGGDADPAGRHGTAHLVEHLMFPRAAATETDDGLDSHVARVEGAGGVCNAETHRDHTVFHTTVPAELLPEVLEWEARRLLTFAPDGSVLRTETSVIAEEIRGAAAAGRVWEAALGALYPGSRDSFGTPGELARATAAEAGAFFRRHYRPDAMVLSVVGDVDPDRVAASVDSHFGQLPAGEGPLPAPSPAPSPAPAPAVAPAVVRTAPLASPVSGAALGHPLPDPVRDRAAYLAHVVLAETLSRSRLPGLTRRDPRITSARVTCGYLGQWLGSAVPDLALAQFATAPGADVTAVLGAWREVLAELAARPADAAEHRRAVNALLLACHRRADSLTARSVSLGRTALLFPGAGGPDALPRDLARVTAAEVSAAAAALLAGPCSVTALGEIGETR
ncbi:insulinase family protein [Streptomyces sp. NBC_00249]|uniref:M16 family metallopeptidase n=1 Tax=Streptomyces sp. NBC_00249 TaxID=2975690 RepID=UPI002259F422|nr:insulinase family protein [Streptomyces sp. NBC_00249]MCX5195988.1 insulinase family protein [Streptomyces sp. NBC_00249]